MTLIEKILASHSKYNSVKPDDIVDILIDTRAARDFGGANVVRNLQDYGLPVDDPGKTLFTFDCNPTGSDQKYAENQHLCRIFARNNNIRVFDINAGIGTHILIDEGFVYPGSTAISTDSHANILGAVGAFGQGMGDQDIAAAWHKGKVWFKVPHSVRLVLAGELPPDTGAKDMILNLLNIFGANSLLGFSVEIYGSCTEKLTLDEKITIASMATEMGAIIILFPPDQNTIGFCRERSGKDFLPLFADKDANYFRTFEVDVTQFRPMVSRPGEPHNTVNAESVAGQKIDSAFIGSCTNGRMTDMRNAAKILKGRSVAPGVVLKIVPATDRIWNQCLSEGIIDIFKKAGVLVSNAGCAGCAAGQVGQNGSGEITVSTGNRNFPGKQGKGSVWLASPEIAAASAVAGYLTLPGLITTESETPLKKTSSPVSVQTGMSKEKSIHHETITVEGNVWIIDRDNIDTDMIYHNSHLAVTDRNEMGRYTFGNLEGFEDFPRKASPGDIIITGKNFGCGSSRQQAVDCFVSLGISAVIAESFGAIYERNAINAAFPILTYRPREIIDIKNGDRISINFETGQIIILENSKILKISPFNDVQLEIYRRGGLLG